MLIVLILALFFCTESTLAQCGPPANGPCPQPGVQNWCASKFFNNFDLMGLELEKKNVQKINLKRFRLKQLGTI